MSTEKWTTKNIPDMRGKTVIITGANSGIGYEAARALATRNARVIMACRNLEKGEQAASKIRAETPTADLKVMALDLADLASVRRFAEAFLGENTHLDILINNAGIMAVPYGKTVDGFEMQIGTNHFGHFLLTGLLFDSLEKTPKSRVVTVSSYAHAIGRINFDDLNSEKSYQRWLAYGQSKLANLLFAYELQRRTSQKSKNPVSVAVHPGYAATNLQHTSWSFSLLNPIFAQSPEMGALPTLYAATSPDIRGGEFIGPDSFFGQRGYPTKTHSSRRSYDEETARRLWEISEQATGVSYLETIRAEDRAV
jgi:NAD(P)-dependent dehydrogenase (short-subunit alcohol dehydrogenase family)